MTCQQTNTSITVGGPVDPVDLSFELQSSITITFVPPSGQSITGVMSTPQSTPPSTYPNPSVGTDSVTFYDPEGAAVDFTVDVRDSGTSEAPKIGIETPPTTIIFKPRTTCPG